MLLNILKSKMTTKLFCFIFQAKLQESLQYSWAVNLVHLEAPWKNHE